MPTPRSMQIASLNSPTMAMGPTGGVRKAGYTGGAVGPGGSDPNDDNGQSVQSRIEGMRQGGELPARDMTGFGAGLGWDDWFDATKVAAGGKNVSFAGGQSAPGSNQLRGTSTQPVFSSGGSSMPGAGARRPSMAAVSDDGRRVGETPDPTAFNDYLATMDRGNENERQGRSLERLDIEDGNRFDAAQRQSAADSDLFTGHAAARSSSMDAIRRDSGMRQGQAKGEADYASYFAPGANDMRRDQDRRSLDALRQRYVDPAIIKGQADLQKQSMANFGRNSTEAIRQEGGVNRANVEGRSRVGAAFATQGDTENAREMAPPMAPTDNVFPAARLQEFMADNGIQTEAEAMDLLKMHGYAVR